MEPIHDKYSVILPTYNERRNLPIVVWLLARMFEEQSVSSAMHPTRVFGTYRILTRYLNFFLLCYASRKLDYEVVVVDDASPDGTQDVAKELQRIYGEDRIVGCLC